ncbi:MAG: hypothetical protein H6739_10220 [Alphaproteobacteria bacterium]|nr:hypothetical protein [Alphaproteobacteria bacterium]
MSDALLQLLLRQAEAGEVPDPLLLADLAWLHARMLGQPVEGGPPDRQDDALPADDKPHADDPEQMDDTEHPDDTADQRPGDQDGRSPSPTAKENAPTTAPQPDRQRARARVPALRQEAPPLALSEALRPLVQRRARPTSGALDDVATLERFARTGFLHPVYAQEREKRLRLAIVVDRSRTMEPWAYLLPPLLRVLKWQRAFREVSVWGLDASADPRVAKGLRDPPTSPPETLADPTGQQLVLVLSDLLGSGWWTGTVPGALRSLGRHGPVLILSVLPPTLLRRTAVRRALPGHLHSLGALTPLAHHRWAPLRRRHQRADPVPVPVLSFSPEALGQWARQLASGGALRAADWVAGTAPRPPQDAAQRVERFQAASSEDARLLAGLVAMSPALSLPMVRYIRQIALPQAGPEVEAELWMGGLFVPAGASHDFAPGVRARLLDAAPLEVALDLLTRVGEKLGHSNAPWAKVLADPEALAATDLDPVVAEVLGRLGGVFAGAVEREAGRPPPAHDADEHEVSEEHSPEDEDLTALRSRLAQLLDTTFPSYGEREAMWNLFSVPLIPQTIGAETLVAVAASARETPIEGLLELVRYAAWMRPEAEDLSALTAELGAHLPLTAEPAAPMTLVVRWGEVPEDWPAIRDALQRAGVVPPLRIALGASEDWRALLSEAAHPGSVVLVLGGSGWLGFDPTTPTQAMPSPAELAMACARGATVMALLAPDQSPGISLLKVWEARVEPSEDPVTKARAVAERWLHSLGMTAVAQGFLVHDALIDRGIDALVEGTEADQVLALVRRGLGPDLLLFALLRFGDAAWIGRWQGVARGRSPVRLAPQAWATLSAEEVEALAAHDVMEQTEWGVLLVATRADAPLAAMAARVTRWINETGRGGEVGVAGIRLDALLSWTERPYGEVLHLIGPLPATEEWELLEQRVPQVGPALVLFEGLLPDEGGPIESLDAFLGEDTLPVALSEGTEALREALAPTYKVLLNGGTPRDAFFAFKDEVGRADTVFDDAMDAHEEPPFPIAVEDGGDVEDDDGAETETETEEETPPPPTPPPIGLSADRAVLAFEAFNFGPREKFRLHHDGAVEEVTFQSPWRWEESAQIRDNLYTRGDPRELEQRARLLTRSLPQEVQGQLGRDIRQLLISTGSSSVAAQLLPWELLEMRGFGTFAAGEGNAIVRVLRDARWRPPAEGPEPCALFLWSDAGGSLDVHQHRNALESGPLPVVEVDQVTPKKLASVLADLRRQGRTPWLVHVLCHTSSDSEETWMTWGDSAPTPTSPSHLGELFEPHPAPALLSLAIPNPDLQGQGNSLLLARLVEQLGVPAVGPLHQLGSWSLIRIIGAILQVWREGGSIVEMSTAARMQQDIGGKRGARLALFLPGGAPGTEAPGPEPETPTESEDAEPFRPPSWLSEGTQFLSDPSGNPNDLRVQRWGVIVPEGEEGEALLDAIRPLIAAREEEQGAYAEVLRLPVDGGGQPEAIARWFRTLQHRDLPRYLTLVGTPDRLPFMVERILPAETFVGRIAFDELDAYRFYAERILHMERTDRPTTGEPPIRVHAVQDGSRALGAANEYLVRPLRADLSERAVVTGDDLTLLEALPRAAQEARQGVLLSISQGRGAPPREGWADPAAQRRLQGALKARGSNEWLTASSVAEGSWVEAGAWIAFAAYAAGTLDRDTIVLQTRGWRDLKEAANMERTFLKGVPLDPAGFIAPLPQAALLNPAGPLVFIGALNQVTDVAFRDYANNRTPAYQPIMALLRALADGRRAGVAMSPLRSEAERLNADLMHDHDREARALARGNPFEVDTHWRAYTWMRSQALSDFILLGDPAVRLTSP